MKRVLVISGILALAVVFTPAATLAESNDMSGSASVRAKANVAGTKSLARADVAAGTHGLKGRNVARTRGSHRTGFCPPGQAKKPGLGSRFQC